MTHALHRFYRELNDRFPRLKHFVEVTRFDRPIGTLLLLWPTLTALWLAAEGWPGWHLLIVFSLGTLLTRSAGCIVNDYVDQGFDGSVERTKNRPLATGKIDGTEALLLTGIIGFLCLLLVLTTNWYTVGLSFVAVIVATIYPLMKRYTYLPQAVLGIAFSMGILMAFTAVSNEISNVAWLLLIGNLIWVVAYDTEYAMVDRDDDIRLGLKSSAILFADLDRHMIGILQIAFLFILLLIPKSTGLGLSYYAGLAVAAGLLTYQQYLIYQRSREGCFKAFLNNHWVGFSIFTGVVIHYALI